MDKSWVNESRVTSVYKVGVERFLDLAFEKAAMDDVIPCPCATCSNIYLYPREIVREHLICVGFEMDYARGTWYLHGELGEEIDSRIDMSSEDEADEVDDMHGMIDDAFGVVNSNTGEPTDSINEPNAEAAKFYKLVEDADRELYPGCKKYNKLSFIVRLYHLKCLNGWSDKSFSMLLYLLKDALPEGETLPKSFYYTKKIISDLGIGYNKIDACPNDCMLYWKGASNLSECTVCQTSRWQPTADGEPSRSKKVKKVPAKVLRHFPLKPRLQRLFMSSRTAGLMRWHAEGRTKDGALRHPADSAAWATLDNRFPQFAADSRNVRLGLASDGFNPFGTLSISHSTWPVVLMPYNLPPWLCMKQPYFMMSLLIPGPRTPGNDLDVYLQPLIEELKDLWSDGLITYDASTKQNFVMRAAVIWTISDFPAYANLSGWSTKGKYACPHCNLDTWSEYLYESHKYCYLGHRRWLELSHRFQRDKASFDGKTETRAAPLSLSGTELFEQCCDIDVTFGKKPEEETRRNRIVRKHDGTIVHGWKKESIFFTLPYWEHLLLRHNLDVMHIEKNVCESVVGTLLHMPGSTKDSVQARHDLKQFGIRHALQVDEDVASKMLPPACYTMSPTEKDIFCKVLSRVKVPDGYAANISRCVRRKQRRISGLKSHDFHIIMQQLLPLVVRKVLPHNVSAVLIELSSFFRELCSKDSTTDAFSRLQSRIALTLCNLERIFPPAFFDSMIHLPIHLATEAMITGPVHYRWMYPVERYLHTLKSYVRNKNRPEGSLAEGYIVEESLTFCTRYLNEVETKLTRVPRNDDDGGSRSNQGLSIFSGTGRALKSIEYNHVGHSTLAQLHSYVLFNCPEVIPVVERHFEMLRKNNPNMPLQDVKRMHKDQFPDWFEYIVDNEHLHDDEVVRTDLQWLAKGPDTILGKCNRFVINGYRFRTKDVDERSKTQNSGVVVTARTTNDEDVTYYGKLIDIIQLNYYGTRKVVLFQCDWVQDRAVKKDRYGFTLVNFNRRLVTEEPYVLASQVLQVFYVPDPVEKEWDVAIKILPRDLFKMVAEDEETDDVDPNDVDPNYLDPTLPIEAEIDPQIGPTMVDVDIRPNEVRPNVPAIPVDESTINNQAGEDKGILYDG